MLWRRSASLMRTTRMSWAIARSIFRMFSACCSSWEWVENLDSFVTPSTSWATSAPKRSSMSARLRSVSSGTSCSRAASIAVESRPRSASVKAAAIGWVTYGSPVARTWPCVGGDREVEGTAHGRRVDVRPGGGDRGDELPAQDRQRPELWAVAARGRGATRLCRRRFGRRWSGGWQLLERHRSAENSRARSRTRRAGIEPTPSTGPACPSSARSRSATRRSSHGRSWSA